MKNDSLIYRMGLEIGRQLNRMGIHTNFAPDADVNNNAQNPVIGSRSSAMIRPGFTSCVAVSKGTAILAYPGNGSTSQGTVTGYRFSPGAAAVGEEQTCLIR